MSWSDAIKSSLKRPTFLVVLIVLLVGAVGINYTASAMKLKFRKEAMALRDKDGLNALPQQLGSWVIVPEPQTVNPDLVHDLGTDKFVFREYVDTSATAGGVRIATKEDVLALENMTPEARHRKLLEYRSKNNNCVMRVAVTYYTGKVDTVPHVPDRCYVADGFQPAKYDVNNWALGTYATGAQRTVPVRFIDFEDQTSRGAQNRCVGYFFHANGDYEENPNKVRVKLQNLFEKHAYFAKIEVMTLLPVRPGATANDPLKDGDRKAAEAAMQRFLTAALPEVEKLLPDWQSRAQ